MFSIILQTIKNWNIDNSFRNGVLIFIIDGKTFPESIDATPLNCEIPPLKEKLNNLTISETLYSMEKDKAFTEIYNITFPEDISVDGDDCFNISPLSFSDKNCYVFAVSNGQQARIMAANLHYIKEESRHELKNINVSEAFITINELNNIILELSIS